MPDAAPRLRPEIDAVPAVRDGAAYYILHDRSGVSAARLLVSPLGLLIAGRLDGCSSVLDIADAMPHEAGEDVSCASVERLVHALDEAFFLEGARFQDHRAQAERDFRSAPLRMAESAGSAYDAAPAALSAELERMMREAPMPEETPACPADRHPRGIVAPHIDFSRGGAGYGQCYRFLRERPGPETVVVLGTAHMPMRERFCLCEKDFDTPLGRVAVDSSRAGEIRRRLEGLCRVDRDLLVHRGEHSIELQAVWLRHVYGENVRIVPLLAASVGDFLDGTRDPAAAMAEPAIRELAACLGEMAEAGGVMLLASADLSHVGPRFGDGREVTTQFLTEVEDADRNYLECVATSPLQGLRSLARHGDRHHVCGSAGIFALGLALPGAETSLLGYHQAVTPEMRQAVTYAAMVFA